MQTSIMVVKDSALKLCKMENFGWSHSFTSEKESVLSQVKYLDKTTHLATVPLATAQC